MTKNWFSFHWNRLTGRSVGRSVLNVNSSYSALFLYFIVYAMPSHYPLVHFWFSWWKWNGQWTHTHTHTDGWHTVNCIILKAFRFATYYRIDTLQKWENLLLLVVVLMLMLMRLNSILHTQSTHLSISFFNRNRTTPSLSFFYTMDLNIFWNHLYHLQNLWMPR